MAFKLKYTAYNERSILIEWPAIIDEKILKNILLFKYSIENNFIKQTIEVVNAYNSLLIIYEHTIDNINNKIKELKTLNWSLNGELNIKNKHWAIPVCYDNDFAQDIEKYSKEINCSKADIITIHTQPKYRVFFTGFLPGFLYLGGLDPRLFLDRKSVPNLKVKKGSVAIGGKQTGIYPKSSPGGWHVIGNCPVELFNPKSHPPCQIEAGDTIQFYGIDKAEYYEILERIDKSEFNLKPNA
ncbi:MAG: 5-oxoprolinase subunit PxpB [Winogradskyella sp.]|uniref:5-oxoprolinase subunit PxpB n=1 Tax=Winogradskyella sp. TaxID=1883156 RepID=UPI00182D5184|nr:5-oxoprolinase subunit PxpB [Winogradskyella sp.]